MANASDFQTIATLCSRLQTILFAVAQRLLQNVLPERARFLR
ncbi:hypothetical protein I603_1622 [Erythrobacter dokdonensis DSW-74]|uniref:Uncharacterized protein n=1 Tax=Erythrobacter dokdonensis DSW-74 TaxID=1300349 RepID=A0A1A7BFE7_9SPHN|nr:hypothetical protein I603_1622 [Erythrobacter dokdonensis DSW-74]